MEMFEAIRKKYGSRDWGGRIVYGDYKYCFQPLKFELADDGRYYYSEPMADEEWKDLEIVARGILADYIKTSDEKQIKQLFEDYYSECFNTYKGNKQRKHDIDIMLKSESEIETLFVETMLEEEAWRIEVSLKKLEKYTTDDERNILHKVGEGFMAHLRNRLQELKPDTTPERQSAGGKGKSRSNRFSTTIKEDNARKVFSLLASQSYISNDTQPNDWLWICGIDTDKEPTNKQIDWLKGQNELVYFVGQMFVEENGNDLWAIASRVFTIKGKTQDGDNLRKAYSKASIKNEKKVKLDKLLKYR